MYLRDNTFFAYKTNKSYTIRAMIIGFDASRAFINNRTGTENYSYQLLKHLAKIDTKNIYKVYIRSNSKVGKGWPKNFQFKVINFPRLWTQAGLASKTFTDKIDILFVPSHTLPIIKRPGLKTVMTVHDLGAEYLPKMHQLKQRLYLKMITNLQLKSATKLIAVSEATKKDLIEKVRVSSKNIKVIYEGINTQFLNLPQQDALLNTLNKYNLERDSYFIFVGTIQPRKNLSRLIKAFALLESRLINNPPHNLKPKTYNLILVGSKGWLSDDIYSLPKRLGVEKKVKFLGHIPDKDLPSLYSGSLGLVFPSLFEGFGLPILEAFSLRTPVLTSNTSSMPEVAGDAAILVNPLSIDDMINGLIKLLDKNKKKVLISRGTKRLKNFSWEKCAQKTLNLLEEVYNSDS